MWNLLELSDLFVCLGGLMKLSSTWEYKKIAGLWFARGDQYPGLHHGIIIFELFERAPFSCIDSSHMADNQAK